MSRRVIIKGVKVIDGIASGDRNGKISQNGSEIALYDQSKSVVLAAEAEGDLIAYPCIRIANGTTTLQLSVWQTSDFTESGSPSVETTLTVSDKTVEVGKTVNADVQTNSPGAITYTSDNVQIASVDDQGVITGVAEGETNINVSLAASGNYEAKRASFKITVTAAAVELPTTVAGIVAQIPDTATGSNTAVDYAANLAGAVVSYVNGNNAYIEDESGAILIYMSGHGLAAGDVISGKVSGKGYKYNGLPEITSIGTEFSKSTGGNIPLTEITLANLIANFNANMSRRVIIKGVKVIDGIASGDRNGKISQGQNEMALYDQSKSVVLAAEAEGDLIAYPCIRIYNNTTTLQLSVWQTSDFTESGGPAQETTLTAVDKTVEVGKTVNAEVTTNSPGALSYSSENSQIASVDNQGVITGVSAGETNITVTVAASGNYAEKSVSFKVTVTEPAQPGGNDGSLEKPYTASEAAALAASGDTGTYYITGKVTKVAYQFNTGGTASVWLDENGQSQSLFEGYRLKYIGNVNWVTGNALLAVGDDLIINGPLTLYTNTNTGAQTPETNGGYIVSWNGKTKALSVPTVTPTPDNDNKQIAVAWTGATGTDAAISYVVKCGTQSIDATAAGRHVFTMDAYGTYEISVEASASDAIGSKATASATLSDPTPPTGGGNDVVVLSEDFSDVTNGNSTSSNGSSQAWNGNTNFPTVNTAYQAGGAVKIGKSGGVGSITSKALDLSKSFTVSIDIKGWTNVEGKIKVTVGNESKEITYTETMSSTSFGTYTVDFSAATASSTVVIATTAKRAFVDNIIITRHD